MKTKHDLSFDEYSKLPGEHFSTLKWVGVSPLHYHYRMSHAEPDADHYRRGRALHCLIGEPERFDLDYVVWTGAKRFGKEWDRFVEQHGERWTILTEADATKARDMAAAIRAHPLAAKHVGSGLHETALQWTDRETGIKCKARVDCVNAGIKEIKTTADVNPIRFAAACARYRYHVQLALYSDGLRECGYESTEPAAMIVVESTPPHDVHVYRVHDDLIDQGRRVYRSWLRIVKTCRETDTWPGQCGSEWALVLPAWADQMDESEPDQPVTIGGVPVGV